MKINGKKIITGLCFILMWAATVHAETYTEKEHYTGLKEAQATQSGKKIEVLEFFWYGCPHCYQFEPTVAKWKKSIADNVHFIRVPAPLNPSWMPHTKAYYALQVMGKGEQYHNALFKAMHVDKKRLYDMASITEFLVSQGVDEKEFTANVSSFAVEMRARQAMLLSKGYHLTGVPMMAVNGKYTISAKQAGGYQQMMDIVNHLVNKEK